MRQRRHWNEVYRKGIYVSGVQILFQLAARQDIHKVVLPVPSGKEIEPVSYTHLNLKKPEKKTEKEKVALLWAGRMVNRKGLALLLDILKLVKTKKEYVLRLAGNGPEMENLKRQTADLGLKDKVEFLGKVSYKEMRQI